MLHKARCVLKVKTKFFCEVLLILCKLEGSCSLSDVKYKKQNLAIRRHTTYFWQSFTVMFCSWRGRRNNVSNPPAKWSGRWFHQSNSVVKHERTWLGHGLAQFKNHPSEFLYQGFFSGCIFLKDWTTLWRLKATGCYPWCQMNILLSLITESALFLLQINVIASIAKDWIKICPPCI